MPFSEKMSSVNVTRSSLSRKVRGRIYTTEDISEYVELQQEFYKRYMALGVDGKVAARTGEAVTIRGMVDIPGASDYMEAVSARIHDVVSAKGDLSKVGDPKLQRLVRGVRIIEETVPDVPIPFEESAVSLKDIVARIGGMSYPVELEVSPEDIDRIVMEERVQQPSLPAMGDAFVPRIPPLIAAPQPVPEVEYGIRPNIVIESPDVTVQSLDDEIDSGEF